VIINAYLIATIFVIVVLRYLSSNNFLVPTMLLSSITVVRAMNDFNEKCYFSGSDSSETLRRIFTKFGTADYVGERTPHANVGINRFQGGVSAHA